MPKILSAEQILKILRKNFGFEIETQKGSHIKLKKVVDGNKIITIVPNHKEVAMGTLKSVLDLAKINPNDFWDCI